MPGDAESLVDFVQWICRRMPLRSMATMRSAMGHRHGMASCILSQPCVARSLTPVNRSLAPPTRTLTSMRTLIVRSQANKTSTERKDGGNNMSRFRPPSKVGPPAPPSSSLFGRISWPHIATDLDPLARPFPQEEASLRAEAEAPFRSLRLVLFGFGTVSATLATLFCLPTILGALLGAAGATKPLSEAALDLAINVGALAGCGFLLRRDLQARNKQIARLMREDQLGSCQLELANGRLLRLGQLRGAARPVVVAGTPEQVAAAVAAAEPYKQELSERGVLVIGLPIYASTEEGAPAQLPALAADDLRWRAVPIRTGDWKQWFDEQAAASSKATAQGLYVGLRMDGRVRASGLGCPPWAKFAAQLPATEGFFGGLLDGMDGKV